MVSQKSFDQHHDKKIAQPKKDPLAELLEAIIGRKSCVILSDPTRAADAFPNKKKRGRNCATVDEKSQEPAERYENLEILHVNWFAGFLQQKLSRSSSSVQSPDHLP